ncbi:MAG TPA: hypothetical protein ENN17_11830 [bacterium]|nr:hypothetical protein [bacterium]
MRRFLFSVLAFCFACAGPRAQYSAFTLRFLNDIESLPSRDGAPLLDDSIRDKYLVRDYGEGDVVHAFLRLTSEPDPEKLDRLGVSLQSRTGDLATAVIPVRSLRNLGKVRGIAHIEISAPVHKRTGEASL